jgi:hypothetical protein
MAQEISRWPLAEIFVFDPRPVYMFFVEKGHWDRFFSKQSVCVRKVLRPAISLKVFLVFLCLQAYAEMDPKFQLAAYSHAAFPI